MTNFMFNLKSKEKSSRSFSSFREHLGSVCSIAWTSSPLLWIQCFHQLWLLTMHLLRKDFRRKVSTAFTPNTSIYVVALMLWHLTRYSNSIFSFFLLCLLFYQQDDDTRWWRRTWVFWLLAQLVWDDQTFESHNLFEWVITTFFIQQLKSSDLLCKILNNSCRSREPECKYCRLNFL